MARLGCKHVLCRSSTEKKKEAVSTVAREAGEFFFRGAPLELGLDGLGLSGTALFHDLANILARLLEVVTEGLHIVVRAAVLGRDREAERSLVDRVRETVPAVGDGSVTPAVKVLRRELRGREDPVRRLGERRVLVDLGQLFAVLQQLLETCGVGVRASALAFSNSVECRV